MAAKCLVPLFRNAVFHNESLCQFQNIARSVRFHTTTDVRGRKSTVLLGFVGVGVGAFVGAGYGYRQYKKDKKTQNPVLNFENDSVSILKSLPPVEVSKRVVVPSDVTDVKLKLFQYATCPFCCKVRAFLDYYGFSYDVIEVNPVMRQQIKWSAYKKVPIIVAETNTQFHQLNDSSMIVSALRSHLEDRDVSLPEILKYYPVMSYNDGSSTKNDILNKYFLMFQDNSVDENKKESLKKWRKWADDVLVHVLSPNVYRTPGEAVETFKWFSKAGDWEKHFSSLERWVVIYVGAYAMWLIGKRLKKRHNLKDDVRESFYEECNVWVKELRAKGTPFMGGDSPNLADLAVFGVLSSVEGSQAFQDVQRHTRIAPWYWDMKHLVKNHGGCPLMKSAETI